MHAQEKHAHIALITHTSEHTHTHTTHRQTHTQTQNSLTFHQTPKQQQIFSTVQLFDCLWNVNKTILK